MKRLLILMTALSVAGCGPQVHRIGIVAHRGYWNCEEGGFTPNSVAAFRSAGTQAFYGSEFDLHLTSDGEIVVWHDDHADGIRIDENPYAALSEVRCKNGEPVPTLLDFLKEAGKTLLVVELKVHPTAEQEDRLVEKTLTLLKEYGLYDPQRVMFISFSLHSCTKVAELAPGFTVQYLTGDLSPEDLHKAGVNGLDYHYSVFYKHPDWVEEAHRLGMSVNCWTVNRQEDLEQMVALGVDQITTDEPMLLRKLLGDRELRL